MTVPRRTLLLGGPLSILASLTPRARGEELCRLPSTDGTMQHELERSLARIGVTTAWRGRRLSVSLMDVTDPENPVYAGVNDQEMMYAASLPKIAILLAGFERIREGLLRYTPAVREMFTRLARFSSNTDASRAIQTIGFEYIAKTLRKYGLYDTRENGGLWLGKAYGGPNDYWRRDPLHNLSHGATAAQVTRFFWLMDQGRLVNERFSAEIKQILSHPGIQHKFVKGLAGIPDRVIYRKSGTWRNWHADGALIEAGEKKYIAVALMEDPRGGDVLPRLIREMDRIVCGPAPALATS